MYGPRRTPLAIEDVLQSCCTKGDTVELPVGLQRRYSCRRQSSKIHRQIGSGGNLAGNLGMSGPLLEGAL